MVRIPVELGARRYFVHVGLGAVDRLSRLLHPFRGRRIVVVSSPRIWSLHGRRVERELRRLGSLEQVLVSDGESRKTPATLGRIHDGFLRARLGRDGLVAALGGGVIGDVAGFAAATYMRGVDVVQLPTTLLSMVDSSIGGKVGVNHPKAKNLIGVFHQPRAVVVDTSFLETLPARERQSGAYEVLKCGILGDAGLFAALADAPRRLEGWGRRALELAVASACRIKASVVSRDERDGGPRRVLNLGHTLGHALEAVTSYRRFTHGEAVGWGLIGAARLALGKSLLSRSAFERITAAVDRLGPRPGVSDLDPDEILAAVAKDKKARAGIVPFVLPIAVGRVVIRSDVREAEVRRVLGSLSSHRLAPLRRARAG